MLHICAGPFQITTGGWSVEAWIKPSGTGGVYFDASDRQDGYFNRYVLSWYSSGITGEVYISGATNTIPVNVFSVNTAPCPGDSSGITGEVYISGAMCPCVFLQTLRPVLVSPKDLLGVSYIESAFKLDLKLNHCGRRHALPHVLLCDGCRLAGSGHHLVACYRRFPVDVGFHGLDTGKQHISTMYVSR